jgi:glycerate dehydrogenase
MRHSFKIVLLDSDTISIDHGLQRLSQFGEFHAFTSSSNEEVKERIRDAHVVLTNKAVVGRDAMAESSSLRFIQVLATGVNNIDMTAASELGVVVSNVADYSTYATAQHALALLLGLVSGVPYWYGRAGMWASSKIFWESSFVPTELRDKRCGVIGFGAIGSRFATVAECLGMEVVGLDRKGSAASKWPRLDLEELLATSDVVSLHCPLTEKTRKMINSETLAMMKAGAFLINVARGGLVDEVALVNALTSGHLGGAGVDVSEYEPPNINSPLLTAGLSNLLVTPHIAWAAAEAQQRLVDSAFQKVYDFLDAQVKAKNIL